MMRSHRNARREGASNETESSTFWRGAALGLAVLLTLPSLSLAEDAPNESEDQLPPAGNRVILWERDRAPRGQAFSLDDTIAAGVVGTYLFGGAAGAALGGLVLCAALFDDGYRRSPPSHRTLIEMEIEMGSVYLNLDARFRLRLKSEGTWIFASPRLHVDQGEVLAPTHRSDLLLRLETTVQLPVSLEIATGIEAGRSGGRLSIYVDESGMRGELLHVQERTVDRLVGFVRMRVP